MIEFTVYGEPTGKGRPKFSTFNGRAMAYTPKKTENYESYVKLAYQASGAEKFPDDVQIYAEIDAYYAIPKSTSKKKKQKMIDGEIRPTKKPDTDNIAKIILDALNGIAYHDDAQVVSLSVRKYYSEEPRVEVVLSD